MNLSRFKKPRNNSLTLAVFLLLSVSGIGFMAYLSASHKKIDLPFYGSLKGYFEKHTAHIRMETTPKLASFTLLDEALLNEGMTAFADKKRELKKEVQKTLGESADENERNRAQSIAVYLFPDLLPYDDFERDVAFELWFEHQQSIEKNPKTEDGRQTFEQMRANIWNYESADKVRPEISDTAEQAIRIYDVMTEK
jgi:hypothetical protein